MTKTLLQIGIVAKEAQVNIQTIRYYERRGLLKPQVKKDSGYRLYSQEAIQTLKFIKHAQELGFRLDEIKELIGLRAPSINQCEKVRAKASQKLEDVREKISMLQGMEATLQKLIKHCSQNKTTATCPIIDSIEDKG